jgi:hypothetical protein
MYFYTDNDSQSQQFVGTSSYAVTFAKGQLPSVRGFWSLTMYNPSTSFTRMQSIALRSAPRHMETNDNHSHMLKYHGGRLAVIGSSAAMPDRLSEHMSGCGGLPLSI